MNDRGSASVPDAVRMAADLRVVLGQLRRRMRGGEGIGDFTPSQVAVVARLDREGPSTLSALARAEGMRPQSMRAIVSVLEAAALVSGTPDPSDGRQTILSLTPRAREVIDAGRAARADWLLRAIEANLTPAEQAELARGVVLLVRLLDN
jgi:DNA-binding MarR family transcriptional regulator